MATKFLNGKMYYQPASTKGEGVRGYVLSPVDGPSMVQLTPCVAMTQAELNTVGQVFATSADMLKALKMVERVFNVKEVDPLEAFATIEVVSGVLAKAKEKRNRALVDA